MKRVVRNTIGQIGVPGVLVKPLIFSPTSSLRFLLSPLRSLPLALVMSFADLLLDNVPLPSLPSYLTHYEPGFTPLSTASSTLVALVTYLIVIFGLQEAMRSRHPLKMTTLFQLHNMLLSSGSLLLLVLMVEEIAPIVFKRGMFYGICGKDAWTPVRGIDRLSPTWRPEL